jgi:hypothetical protein
MLKHHETKVANHLRLQTLLRYHFKKYKIKKEKKKKKKKAAGKKGKKKKKKAKVDLGGTKLNVNEDGNLDISIQDENI